MVSNIFAFKILLGYISISLFGFIPGFYLSYLIINKISKKCHAYFILFYFISGLFFGFVSWGLLFALDSIFIHNKFWNFFANSLPYIVLLELALFAIHFFYFKKLKQVKK